MRELSVLEQIESASGKLDKRSILKQNTACQELAELLDAVFNYKRKFYIKKWDLAQTPGPGNVSHQEFMLLLKELEQRKVTGDLARMLVENFFARCNEIQSKWYARVLRKDLRAGFSVDTAIDCGFKNIPAFDVQLATDHEKCKRYLTMLSQGMLFSPKLDGYRCVAVIDNGEVVLYTRNGLVYENFPSVQESLTKMFPKAQLVLDGEIMSNDFNSMQQSAFASKRGTTVGDVVFNIFDMIPFDEWESDNFKMTYFKRYDLLSRTLGMFSPLPDNIRLLDHEAVSSLEKAQELEAKWVAMGFEGAMGKPDIPYYRGKSTNKMLKFKSFKSMDCEVLSVYEGENRNVGRLGGFKVRQENGVACDVGGGFSDLERIEIWANPQSVIGRVAEVKYFELTPDQRMRFPVFVRWRIDKDKK